MDTSEKTFLAWTVVLFLLLALTNAPGPKITTLAGYLGAQAGNLFIAMVLVFMGRGIRKRLPSRS